jgi:isoquinoline 1-oxidoreductase alpha subunit
MIEFVLNGQPVALEIEPDTPLLWALRDGLQKTGTKFGCGQGLCGACTVLVNGSPTRSCVLPVASIAGQQVTTIEGLGGEHAVQRAWLDENVSQCGYCQPGQIMTAVGLLAQNPAPTDEDILNAMTGNICRCGTYPRIVKAIKAAAKTLQQGAGGVAIFDPAARHGGEA